MQMFGTFFCTTRYTHISLILTTTKICTHKLSNNMKPRTWFRYLSRHPDRKWIEHFRQLLGLTWCINSKKLITNIYTMNKQSSADLGLPRSAAWWSVLKPLLLVMLMSAACSSSSVSMSSRFLLIASCSGVSPSESYIQHDQHSQHASFPIILQTFIISPTVVINYNDITKIHSIT